MSKVEQAPRPLPKQLQLFGEYVIEGAIEEGPTWAVYSAHHVNRSDERFHARVLRGTNATHRNMIEAFARQTLLLESLRHPGIIPVAAAGVDQGVVFIIMPQVLGETLEARMSREPLTAAELGRIIRETGEVLDYLHKHDPPVLHRTLDPTKILLASPDHQVKVLEVGYAHALDEVSRVEPIDNVPQANENYRAPEDKAGAAITAAADQYSLACVARECLTHCGTASTALRIAADSVLKRAFASVPHSRYQSAGAFAQAFHDAIIASTRPIPGSRPSGATRLDGSLTKPLPPRPGPPPPPSTGSTALPPRPAPNPALPPLPGPAPAAKAVALPTNNANMVKQRKATLVGTPPIPVPPPLPVVDPEEIVDISSGNGDEGPTLSASRRDLELAAATPPPPPTSGSTAKWATMGANGEPFNLTPNAVPNVHRSIPPAAIQPSQIPPRASSVPPAAGNAPTMRVGFSSEELTEEITALSKIPVQGESDSDIEIPEVAPVGYKPTASPKDDIEFAPSPSRAPDAAPPIGAIPPTAPLPPTVAPLRSQSEDALFGTSSTRDKPTVELAPNPQPIAMPSAIKTAQPPSMPHGALASAPPTPIAAPLGYNPSAFPEPNPSSRFPSTPPYANVRTEPPPPRAGASSGVRIARILGISIVLASIIYTAGVTLRPALMELAFHHAVAPTTPTVTTVAATDPPSTHENAHEPAAVVAPSVAPAVHAHPDPSVGVAAVQATPDAGTAAPVHELTTAPMAIQLPARDAATPTTTNTTGSDNNSENNENTAAAGPLHRHPSWHDRNAVEERIVAGINACAGHAGRHARIHVTYEGTTGNTSNVEWQGSTFNGLSITPCIEQVVRANAMPRFTDATWETDYVLAVH